MNSKEKKDFVELLTGLAELYQKPLSARVLEIYWAAFEQYPLDAIKEAVKLHVLNPDNGQFMPKPADILRYLEGKTYEQALRAWTTVNKAMRMVGAYPSIQFEDQLIHLVISEMGGWINLCATHEDRLPFVAKEFQQRYSSYLHHKPMSCPGYLLGIYEQYNSLHNYPILPPVSFKDREGGLLISSGNALEKKHV